MLKNKHILTFITFTFILIFVTSNAHGQDDKRNIIQIKNTINYYKNYYIRPLYTIVYPDISYRRFSRDKQRFFEFASDVLDIRHRFPINEDAEGKILFRFQCILEGKLGTYLVVTPRIKAMAKAGLGFRLGNESRIVNFGLVGGVFPEYIIRRYSYNDIGFNTSTEISYKYSKRWSLCLEIGGRYFINRQVTSKSQWWASLGFGYEF